MIEIIVGKGVGSGKSYFACERLIHHFTLGGSAFASDTFQIRWDKLKSYVARFKGVVLEDDQFRTFANEDVHRLHEVTCGGTDDMPVLILIDEGQEGLNARDWADKRKEEFFKWLCQSRHDSNDVVFVTQAAKNIDGQVRRLATYTWHIRNMLTYPVPGIGKIGSILKKASRFLTLGMWEFHGVIFARSLLDYDGRTLIEKKFVVARREIFDCYFSKAMSNRRPRMGEAIVKKDLKKVEGKSMLKIKIFIAVAVVLFAGWRIYTHGLMPKYEAIERAKAAPTGLAPAATKSEPRGMSAQAASTPRAAYEIVSDKMLSSGPGWLKTAGLGLIVPQELCSLGMVESIHGKIARIRKPDSSLVYVIAADWSVPARAVTEQDRTKRSEVIVAPISPALTTLTEPAKGK